MKFIDGGQLDERPSVSRFRLAPRRNSSPNWRATVHHAHEHGILIETPQAGNVLLDRNGEPHLTGFGLARLVETESTVTATMEVWARPVTWRRNKLLVITQRVSRATDVYGLGPYFTNCSLASAFCWGNNLLKTVGWC